MKKELVEINEKTKFFDLFQLTVEFYLPKGSYATTF